MIAVVADYGDLCGECPVWDQGSGTLYWVDAVGLRFYRYHPESGQHQILKNEIEINGFRLNVGGGFVTTNPSGIWLWDGADHLTLISDHVDGIKCQMNDCVADSRGRLYSGTTYFDPTVEYKLGYLVRIDNDGKASILDEGFHLSNGLAFSPDDRILYFTDSIARRIYAYDYDVATGNIRHRRVLVEVPRTEGIPDGLAVDAEGFLWSAQWYGSSIVRYDPDGKVERRIAIPAQQTSCCAFGGPNLDTLYITSAARSEITAEVPIGYNPEAGYLGGTLYRTRVEVQGRLQPKADIVLTRNTV